MKLEGRIVHIISNLFWVEAQGNLYECTSRGIFKTKELKPVVGDWVTIETNHHTGNITNVHPRKSYLKRPKMANLTQLILVISAKNPSPDLLMLDKQLAFAEFLKVKPMIVVNKIDLDKKQADAIQQLYTNIGYQVIQTNAKEAIGIEPLKECLKHNMSAFSGNSGVGKSTLINGILQGEATQEGEISQKNGKGKNTTTSVKLYPVAEEESYIADTPGFSNFEVYEIPYQELYQYFIEFRQYAGNCKYQDCTHIQEDSCGIKREVGNNIAQSRYESFQQIYAKLKDKEEHKW